jgi:hypothetical protein
MNNIQVILFGLVTFLMFSCDNGVNKDKNSNPQNSAEILNFFPDTILIDAVYEGKINYTSELDTIQLSEEDNRFIFLFISTEKGEFNTVESIKKVKHVAFTSNKENEIYYTLKFDKDGLNYINCIIEDMVILNSFTNDGKSRVLTKLTLINKEILVK